jgi:hypothetical protein
MTFEQFRASGRDATDIGAVLRDDCLMGRRGRLYCEDCLYIEDTGERQGRWYTIIGKREFRSDDLATVEARLYEFAREEGYEVR